ncbi:MAG: hypothetical protein Ct9H300mP23_04720 [Nitrospinota bacterium]|nr:MAG: hypothetical protein Ct9H300mP23_04720 [Nitrospinota bacterium]
MAGSTAKGSILTISRIPITDFSQFSFQFKDLEFGLKPLHIVWQGRLGLTSHSPVFSLELPMLMERLIDPLEQYDFISFLRVALNPYELWEASIDFDKAVIYRSNLR